MSDPLEELRKRYSALETDELFAMVHSDSDQYRPEAIRIAQEELARRGIPREGTAELRQNAEKGMQERLVYEDMPLSTGLKLLCLVLAGMPGLVTYAIMENKGRKRAAREALQWLGIGAGMWFLLGLLLGLTG